MLLVALACAPPAALPEAPSCAVGELWDGAACVPLACGVGTFGGLEAEVYVVEGATGGDGSAEAPYGTLDEARGAASIALGAGTYPDVLGVAVDLTLLGRCPELVTLDQREGGLIANGRTLRVQGLTLRDAPSAALTASRAGRVEARDLVITGAAAAALYVEGEGSVLELTAGHIDGPVDGDLPSWALLAAESGEARLAAVTVNGNRAGGIYATNAGTRVDLVGVRVEAAGGPGVHVASGAAVEMAGGGVVGATGAGGVVEGAGSTLLLAASSLADTIEGADGTGGIGLDVGGGGAAAVRDVVVTGNAEAGVQVRGPGSAVTLERSVVRSTRASAAGGRGFGIVVEDGGSLDLAEVEVDDSVGVGVFVRGGTLTGRDSHVWHTASNANGAFGRGLVAQDGATLDLLHFVSRDNREVGIFLAGAETRARIAGGGWYTTPSELGTGGFGVVVRDGAEVQLYCTAWDNAGVGAWVTGEGTRVDVFTLLIADGTLPTERHPLPIGVLVEDGAVVHGGEYFQALTPGGVGLVIRGSGSVGSGVFLNLEGSLAGTLIEDGDLDVGEVGTVGVGDGEAGGGVGMFVSASSPGAATVAVESLHVGGSPLAGLWVDGPAEVTVASGRIAAGSGVEVGDETWMGNALFARGRPNLRIDGLSFENSAVAVLLDDATASGTGNTFLNNDLDLVQQGCGDVAAPELGADPERTVLCPEVELPVVPLTWSFPDPEIWPM